ncbi:MAG: nitronate monooxygenase [Actinomycetia bacterium]|nr:nitronate monooxygenase [Actinomycetes bacterium]MCP4961460.1 nitronate monooxygenase [Actinomycetes bacterium]
MKTAVTDMLGVEFPILAFSHCRDVVAAVSKAGGFGVLGAVAHSDNQLDIDLQWIEDEIGDRPYGVDLIVPAKYAGDSDGGYSLDDIRNLIPAEHLEFIDDIMARYDVPPLPEGEHGAGYTSGEGDAPFSINRADSQLDIVFAHGPTLVANALGPPPAQMIEGAKANGRLIAALAGRPVHAERHIQAGADLIVAQGSEAGGHTGDIGSMVLIPEIVDAAGDTPVLGAGGIGRGRQMAAAMALGAEGVWCGSVWLTTEEAETEPVVKQKFLAATSADTIRSRSLTGKHARMLKSSWTEEWEREDTPAPLGMPLQPVLTTEAQARIRRAAGRSGSGAEKLANYFVGQIVGTMNQSKSATQVVYDMIEEFIDATERMASFLDE